MLSAEKFDKYVIQDAHKALIRDRIIENDTSKFGSASTGTFQPSMIDKRQGNLYKPLIDL
jgi:hypothetical protein